MTELIDLYRSYSAPGCSNTQTWVQVDRPALSRPVLPHDSWDWLKPSSQSLLDLWENATERPTPDSGIVEIASLPPSKPVPEGINEKRAQQSSNFPNRWLLVEKNSLVKDQIDSPDAPEVLQHT